MIIQCEKCQTRFRLDDSRVKDKGVKVRCTKCKHVFTVHKGGAEAESLATGGFSFPEVHDEAPVAASEEQHISAEQVRDTPLDSGDFEGTSLWSKPAEFSPFETATYDASALPDAYDDRNDSGTVNTPAAVESVAAGGEVDFSSFDFSESESEPDSTHLTTRPEDAFSDRAIVSSSAAPRKEAPQGLDFSDDNMFGAVVQTAPEASNETITFDFEEDSFAESMDMTGQDSSGKVGSLFSLDAPGDAPFNLGEIDFGDELTSVAVQQVNPEDLKPSREILFAPLAEAKDKQADDGLMRTYPGDDSAGDQQEPPPLSIASRRKQSPLFGGLIAVVALLVVSALGYFGYFSFSTPKETVETESGQIGVRAVSAAFIENDKAGELLVISGEALNEYPKPRAALQVKVSLFDASGQSIATKIAYGGNPLTEEQLESLPLDKIEAAMANQFGDSLANMEVAPGKAIPFVVVLTNVPKGARDFGVQSAGSTVATGKQQ